MNENVLLHYNPETGYIIGFFPLEVRYLYKEIPEPHIEITKDKYELYKNNPGKYKLNLKTLEEELIPEPEPQPYEPTLEERNRADIDYIAIMMGVDL